MNQKWKLDYRFDLINLKQFFIVSKEKILSSFEFVNELALNQTFIYLSLPFSISCSFA